MSVPDKRLTIHAYKQLSLFFNTMIEPSSTLSLEVKENLRLQNNRLEQLIEALEMDLLSE
jgi:hypothetical protein